MATNNEPGPFAKIFTVVGLIAGGIGGFEAGGGIGMLIGALLLATVGGFIGRLADAVLAWLIFVAVSIIVILINTAVRRFVWELISSIVSGS